MTAIKSVWTTPDGKTFESKAEAEDHLRRPLIQEALNKLTDNNKELVDWLVENREQIEDVFSVEKIKRVSKKDSEQLKKALDHAVSKLADDKEMAFLVKHVNEVHASFRWPTVKRVKPEERADQNRKELMELTDNNEELTGYIIANEKEILEAYEAGVEKRQVSPKAAEGLALWRSRQAVRKAATEANGDPEAAERKFLKMIEDGSTRESAEAALLAEYPAKG